MALPDSSAVLQFAQSTGVDAGLVYSYASVARKIPDLATLAAWANVIDGRAQQYGVTTRIMEAYAVDFSGLPSNQNDFLAWGRVKGIFDEHGRVLNPNPAVGYQSTTTATGTTIHETGTGKILDDIQNQFKLHPALMVGAVVVGALLLSQRRLI